MTDKLHVFFQRLYDPSGSKGLLGKYSVFFIKFLIFSAVLYLLWRMIAADYFFVAMKLTVAYFAVIEGINIPFEPSFELLYSQGMCSSIPVFIALVLATPGINRKKRLYISVFGVSVLTLFQVMLLISYIYLEGPSAPGALYAKVVFFLSGTGRAALLLMLWFVPVYKQMLPERRKIKGYVCPFCGARKVGILAHITAVHGEAALKSEEVKKLIERNPGIKK